MGAQGLRCLTRCPSVLPGLALAKTRTHHRDGTRCWGRERSKAGLRKRGAKRRERGKQKEKKSKMGQGQARDGEIEGSREKRERKSKEKGKELQGKEAFRKKGKNRAKAPCHSPFLQLPLSPCSKVETGNKSLLWQVGSCCWPGLCLLPGSRSELGAGNKAAMGAGDLPQKGLSPCKVGGGKGLCPTSVGPQVLS